MLFLYPSNYFNIKTVDEIYRSEKDYLQQLKFATATISLESIGATSPKIYPPIEPNTTVIYRGWILTPIDYQLLIDAIERSGAVPFTSTINYLAAHYLPNWYQHIADLTPETKFYQVDEDLKSQLDALGWDKFFIKDYVKSLKTAGGAIVDRSSDISRVIAEMQKFRGTIEGGICVRRVEDFIPATERRYFIINGRAFGSEPTAEIPEIVTECSRRIASKFFSIDIIDRIDGLQRVVEIGDGQVSGLVGWSPERFAHIWSLATT